MRTIDNIKSVSFPLPLLAFAFSQESAPSELTGGEKNFIHFGAVSVSASLLCLPFSCLHLLGVSGVGFF